MSTNALRKQTDFLFRHLLQTLGLTVLLAALIRVFFVSSFVMSGASMVPTLLPGDFLVATKWNVGSLRRGDVVVMHCPNQREKTCLRRVVGVEGDRIEFKDGQLWVNGAAAIKTRKGAFAEELVGGRVWAIWPATAEVDREPLVVPTQHVYMLNDRRKDLEDSRSWGPVSVDQIDAITSRIWLSLDWFEKSGEIREWPRLRGERWLRSID